MAAVDAGQVGAEGDEAALGACGFRLSSPIALVKHCLEVATTGVIEPGFLTIFSTAICKNVSVPEKQKKLWLSVSANTSQEIKFYHILHERDEICNAFSCCRVACIEELTNSLFDQAS